MRRLVLPLILLAAAAAVAQDSKAPTDPQTGPATKPAAQTAPAKDTGNTMTALVISTDPVAKTITVKRDTDPMLAGSEPEKTLIVDAKALTSLKTVQIGEKVKLSLKKDAAGKEVVTTIEKSAVTTAPKE